MTKKLYVIILVVVAALALWWWKASKRVNVEAPLGTDDIGQELERINVNDFDDEFKKVDEDVNSL